MVKRFTCGPVTPARVCVESAKVDGGRFANIRGVTPPGACSGTGVQTMAVNDVRVGLVGCGVHAREVLLPAVQRAGMELAAVCDLDKRLAQRVTRRFGAFRAYQDIGTMVEEMDLDAVLACGPPEMHAEAAEVALRGGCHVWTEMPAAPTSAEAERLAELAADRELIAAVGLVARHAPAYQRLREICTGEQFGEIRSIEVAWWPPKMHGHEDPLLFDLPHALDLVRYIGGDIRRLSVARASGSDAMLVGMELHSGAVASVSFGAPADCPRESVAVASLRSTATAEGRQTVMFRRCGHDEMSVWGTQAHWS
ncbi:MAG: Gfo/Idh/MocA family protein, partial [Armatimonadota bacterium]